MGLTAAQSEAIKYILKNYEENELTAMDVMDSLQLSQSTVAGIIKRLESKGLIERKDIGKRQQKKYYFPNRKRIKTGNYLKKKAVETETILLQGMTAEEQAEFNRLLQKALDNANTARENWEI